MENSEVKVSVWCLAYNHEKYIRKTLEGFVSQKTNFKFEVIINEDASTDSTADIIREYEEKYPDIIKPIYHEENEYSKRLNRISKHLLPRAKGKYVAFCEGDDYWCDDSKLQKQYDIMENDPELSICVHKVQCINEDGSLNSKCFQMDNGSQKISQEQFAGMLLAVNGYPFHTSSFFVRKSVLSSPEHDKLFGKFNGDVTILRSSLLSGKAYYIDEIYSHRRLFSIGSWNERMQKSNTDKKIEFYKRQINGEIIFGEIAYSLFEQKIINNIYHLLVGVAVRYGSDTVKEYISIIEEKFDRKLISESSVKLKYSILRSCPKVFDLTYSIKKKIKHD